MSPSPTFPRTLPKPKISEAALQSTVIAMAKQFGWLCHHIKPGMTRGGAWLTLVQGDPGFVDLVLVRDTRLMFVELKADKGYPTATQVAWIKALQTASAEVEVWKPKDLVSGYIESRLR